MHNLLVWSLSESKKIVFSSKTVSLSSITCCDPIDVTLHYQVQDYPLAFGLTGCTFTAFKKDLDLLIQGQKSEISFSTIFKIKSSKLDGILLEIYQDKDLLAGNLITLDDVRSWASQLELLEVLMQENENEQKNRGKGCCG